MFHFSSHHGACLAAALTLCAPAWADLPSPTAPEAPAPAARLAIPFGTPVSAMQLSNARGGNAAMASSATLSGTVGDNSANNVVTGANTIAASSFAGAIGIPIVIQNTGANVLIQNATVINLQLSP